MDNGEIMPIDKNSLNKLSPEERIKKLKEIEEERKKEILEAEELIKKTKEDIEYQKNIPRMEVPEIKQVDISKLFEASEGLEAEVSNAPKLEEVGSVEYHSVVEFEHESPSYEAKIEQHMKKVEDMIKYQTVDDELDKLTASRSVVKELSKYSKG